MLVKEILEHPEGKASNPSQGYRAQGVIPCPSLPLPVQDFGSRWQSCHVEQEGPDEHFMSELPAGSKGQQERVPAWLAPPGDFGQQRDCGKEEEEEEGTWEFLQLPGLIPRPWRPPRSPMLAV